MGCCLAIAYKGKNSYLTDYDASNWYTHGCHPTHETPNIDVSHCKFDVSECFGSEEKKQKLQNQLEF